MKNVLKIKKFYIFLILLAMLGVGYYFCTPKIVEITMKDVVTQIDNKDFVTAKKKFDLARHLNSFVTRRYTKQLSDICIKQIESNDYNSVKEVIGFIEQLSPSKDTEYAKKLVSKGKEKMELGLYDKAIKYFDIALIFDSSLAASYLEKGKALFKMKPDIILDSDYTEIINLFTTAIDLDANLAEAYVLRGAVTTKKMEETDIEREKAFQDFDKAISLNNNPEAVANAYCYKAIEKSYLQDLDGYVQDKKTAYNLYKNVHNKTDSYDCFKYLEHAGTLLCVLHGKCEKYQSNAYYADYFTSKTNVSNSKSKNQEDININAYSKYAKGNQYLKQGKYREAIDSYYEAKELFESIGDTENAQKAEQAYEEAIEMRCEFGDYCM